ncbi:putative bifunctional diguanylate cyclase/phosphodiesterase [Marinomonas profundimaris]|uniref:Response regulator n=1 Tax=Marinomonas profundimaris TaxID=1208321 RepID=W1S042_9GAMM|nr:GGDEF domain-containing response regulator [Marinomonas profundimaris]ETI60468.1 response regulator [Marinomonas profundimaris]
MNLLIIDDDAVDRMSAIRTLKDSELQLETVDQAVSAEEGISLASMTRYDIILLDYQLPTQNGIEVLRELRGIKDFASAIVMLSHSSDDELALMCVEAGAQDFIMKSEITAPRLKRAILISAERCQLERQVRESHEKLRYLAEQDSLTGLSNRYFFDVALKDALIQACRDKSPLALLLVDLDKFKHINDTFGHVVGDDVLKEIARRLKGVIDVGDKICRLGGDEFSILVHTLENPNQIRLMVDRIIQAVSAPMEIQGKTVQLSMSVGVATYPECATGAAELMKCADVAMYRSKGLGGKQAQYYSKRFHKQVESRIRIENDLKTAIEKDQFILYYQPQVDAETFDIVGVEALIRWEHPELGLIPPDDFIPIAEESDYINELGRWVLHKACEQFGQWMKYPNVEKMTFTIAVNLSARQLKDTGLVKYLLECIERYQIPPEKLELELTESSLESSLVALAMLKSLSDLGVKLALDDFGTGYSSLSHLNKYPFNILKIDKSFVQHIESEEEASLLKAISSFAHSLNYETVAEGVETELQRDICCRLGVKRLQGYLFSRPIPPEDLERNWIK